MNSYPDFNPYICPVLNYHLQTSSMKKPHFAALFTILFTSGLFLIPGSSYSQRASAKNNDLSVDAVDFLVNNTFTLQYEGKMSSTSSFVARIEYVTKNVGTAASPNLTTAFGVGAAWRFYILDSRALAEFSVAPAVDLFFFKNTTLSRNSVLFALGGDGAYKFFFDQFTVEPTLGVRIGFAPGNNLPPGESTFTGVYPVVGVFLGYAW